MMDVSVIIVTWNTCDLLAQCLQSVSQDLQLEPALRAEVFVIDNASSDGSAAMVRDQFPWVQLIENSENVGFARANNQAIKLAEGHFILLLNSDTVLLPPVISSMVNFMDQHDSIGILGPTLVDEKRTLKLSWAKFPTFWSELANFHYRQRKLFFDSTADEPPIETYEVDWMAGACLLLRRKAIDQVGLMDERFLLYNEEVDWCQRIKTVGWHNVYNPHTQVIHREGSSTSQAKPRSSLMLYQSKLLYAQKYFGNNQAKLLQIGFTAIAYGKALLRMVSGQMSAAKAQWIFANELRRMRTIKSSTR